MSCKHMTSLCVATSLRCNFLRTQAKNERWMESIIVNNYYKWLLNHYIKQIPGDGNANHILYEGWRIKAISRQILLKVTLSLIFHPKNCHEWSVGDWNIFREFKWMVLCVGINKVCCNMGARFESCAILAVMMGRLLWQVDG